MECSSIEMSEMQICRKQPHVCSNSTLAIGHFAFECVEVHVMYFNLSFNYTLEFDTNLQQCCSYECVCDKLHCAYSYEVQFILFIE